MRVDHAFYDVDPEFDERTDRTRCVTCNTWHVCLPCVDCKSPMAYAEFRGMGGRCEPCWERFRADSKARLARDLERVDKQLKAHAALFEVKRRNWLDK